MIDDRLSGPKPDALPGCATPRLALSLGKPAIERNPLPAFDGNERQNMAGTGIESPGIVPDRFHVTFYLRTPGGKKPLRTAVMTLAEIEDIIARSNWRAQVGECVG